MVTNPDLQNKIDSEAEKFRLVFTANTPSRKVHEGYFKAGASFVDGILQSEIERLKDKNELAKFCDKQTKFINGLNDEFQSLKDENNKLREALKMFVGDKKISFEQSATGIHQVIRDYAKEALTQKAEE